MAIRQLSVFAENKPGSLLSVIRTLKEAEIDIRAFSIADTQDFGIVRLIVSDTEKAADALQRAGSLVSVTEVAAITIPDRPGALSSLMTALADQNINIEYMYAFVTAAEAHACVVLRVADTKAAEAIARENGLEYLEEGAIPFN